MQNLAYKIDIPPMTSQSNGRSTRSESSSDVCAACGEPLFGPGAEACSWQAWGAFWEIIGTNHVELVCGACGEYLQELFKARD
jgi:hypothetical protein